MAGRRYREWIHASASRRTSGAPKALRDVRLLDGGVRAKDGGGADVRPGGNAIRDANRRTVLQLFRTHHVLSRADAARLSGLTKPTVAAIVDDLVAERVVLEDGPGRSSPQGGRPAALLRFNARHRLVLAAHIGVVRTAVVLADSLGEMVARREFRTRSDGPAAALSAVATAAKELIALAAVDTKTVLSMQVALPGMIDSLTGFCHSAPNLGWRDVDVGRILADALRLPVAVRNTVHLVALAEAMQGAGRHFDSALILYEDKGIGAAFVSGGEVAPGCHGVFGEIGHARLPGFAEPCSCGGKGCFEAVASSSALRARLAAHGEALSRNPYADFGHPDPEIAGVVENAAVLIGTVISWLINLYGPGAVIIAGGFLEGNEGFLDRIGREAVAGALPLQRAGLAILHSTAPFDAPIRGAILKALQDAGLT